ncbi:MAG: polysaccharide biosynthesis protein [Xanthomonadales bacterium]|nr:polysaccharide biosynthesis protein [Xanthomonadales bacterium]
MTARKEPGTYVADMGEPISILDLAVNYLRLFPAVQGVTEIPHRPGEKPDEKLHWPHERLMKTEHPTVMRVADGAQVS